LEKILSIFLKLNFTPNILGCYGFLRLSETFISSKSEKDDQMMLPSNKGGYRKNDSVKILYRNVAGLIRVLSRAGRRVGGCLGGPGRWLQVQAGNPAYRLINHWLGNGEGTPWTKNRWLLGRSGAERIICTLDFV